MRRLLVALTACLLSAVTLATPASAVPAPAGVDAAPVSALTVTAVTLGNVDRVTLTYAGPAGVPTIEANDTPPSGLGSGKPMGIRDSTYFLHSYRWISGPDFDPNTIDNRARYVALPSVRGVLVQWHHGLLYVAVGLRANVAHTVTVDGRSVHIDVSH